MFTNFENMVESNPTINFFLNDVSIVLKNRKKLKQFLAFIFSQEKKELVSLTYVCCTDEYLLDINKRFLDHDYFTDIISFELSQPSEPTNGEIYISTDRVKENAKLNKISFNHELHRVIFHGALHLTGLNDKSPVEAKKMRAKEDLYLNMYFINVPRGTAKSLKF